MIVLRAKQVDFQVTYINLREKPDWFLVISPHGKVPVLNVDEQPLFESSAIAEYLDETVSPRLHPEDPLRRARHRAWTDFVPDFAAALGGVNYASSVEGVRAGVEAARPRLARIEEALASEVREPGPYFGGQRLCLVDAAYAPFLQRFSFCEQVLKTGLLTDYPRVEGWTGALLESDVVRGSVADTFASAYVENLLRRGAHAGSLHQAAAE